MRSNIIYSFAAAAAALTQLAAVFCGVLAARTDDCRSTRRCNVDSLRNPGKRAFGESWR